MYQGEDWKQHVVEYQFNPDIPAEPDTIISIYSLNDSDVIRHAIVNFQKENPDVKVNLFVAMRDDSSATITDDTNLLDTELLSGGGADLLVMDGMDPQNYIDKGMLEDISDVVIPFAESDEIYSCLANIYSTDDKVYVIPTRVYINMLFGNQEDVDIMHTFDGLQAYLKENVFSEYTTKEELSKFLYAFYQPELFSSNGDVNEEQVRKYFELAEQIPSPEIDEENKYHPSLYSFLYLQKVNVAYVVTHFYYL